MDKVIFAEELSNYYGLDLDYIVKPKHGKSGNLSFKELCYLIYEERSISNICNAINISSKTFSKVLSKTFPSLAGNKGNVWRVELLNIIGFRNCGYCNMDLNLLDFYSGKGQKNNKSYTCKSCCKKQTKEYRKLHPEVTKASNAKRRALTKDGLDVNTDYKLVTLIYSNCPTGYHVDHIVPLSKGGLHNETNLCYLPSTLNLKKSDKLPEEVPDIMKEAIFPLKDKKYEHIFSRS